MNSVDLSKYTYNLPDEKIAKHPLEKRDEAKLLIYQSGKISTEIFKNIPENIPHDSTLVFNNTKVIPARLLFRRETGAIIEIFLLQPYEPTAVIDDAMTLTGPVSWLCMIGNARKWKDEEILKREIVVDGESVTIEASWVNRDQKLVQFDWKGENVHFADLVKNMGQVPLPPYLNRDATEEDVPRYQTVYAKKDGAVAAPTAGLHFTNQVFDELLQKGISKEFITLHVGAGTFSPIKVDNPVDHPMHKEQILFKKEVIESLLNNNGKIIPVGTTSMRSLESLYWYGTKILEGQTDFFIPKLIAYEKSQHPSRKDSLRAILDYMEKNNLEVIHGETEIFIFPGYKFHFADGLITNFHQPDSTLILLVAAFIGEDWKKVYNYALENNFRFLSYGDSSLLWRKDQ
ncbi:S-adenosylmethionine:tRNA ribosyltransferase-isomerase [Marinigracilibium pacificum]|uniref:S-adenosylmethionine:tRNA ribosyltransferase-isomerase n=1 Tax=Marinigracilibium pacificum TaxID=2729599 RepID=A0A848J461_9BACT|nr:S-adenosylmethionine:tRNA ribosyltransferase-isomerase [Marinigracilibium pacificum]